MKRQFLLRVELHNLPKPSEMDSREIYDHLHIQLKKRKYSKEIKADTKVDYELLDGMYLGFTFEPASIFTANNAREIALEAIDATVSFIKKTLPNTKLSGAVLVAEVVGTEICWKGLKAL